MTISQINPNQLRPPGDDGQGQIIRIGPEHRIEAIERLVSTGPPPYVDREHARRFMQYATSHGINLENLWSRLDRHGRIESSVLAVPSAGRTAMVFASHPQTSDRVRSLAGLIDQACLHLPALDVNLAQVLLDPEEVFEHDSFAHAGFLDLAVLSYLERPVRLPRGARPPAPQWPAGVTTLPYRDSMRDQLVAVLDQSYDDTMDCPKLRGHRQTSDILDGHRAAGSFDPALWTILQVDGVPRGALLLNPSADHHSIELVYLGLSKAVRGRGLGAQLLRHGLALLASRRERTINLAVDEANSPAIALYTSEGFRPSLRRVAMIRPLSSGL